MHILTIYELKCNILYLVLPELAELYFKFYDRKSTFGVLSRGPVSRPENEMIIRFVTLLYTLITRII